MRMFMFTCIKPKLMQQDKVFQVTGTNIKEVKINKKERKAYLIYLVEDTCDREYLCFYS